MKILLTGATGFLGQEVLKQLLEDPEITGVTVLIRRTSGVTHQKMKEIVLNDFLNYDAVMEDIPADACIWCLGVSQLAVSKEEYIKITLDYAVYAAQTMIKANPDIRFCFVSGVSADQEEKSASLQGRIKGRTEKHLSPLSDHVFLFRSAFIKPAAGGPKRPFVQTLAGYITNVLDLFSDAFSIDVVTLAKCLICVAKTGADQRLLDNHSIRQYKNA